MEERDHTALAGEMFKITRLPHTFGEMGLLASESVATHFEQRAQIAALESHYHEAVEIAHEAEARESSSVLGVAPKFAEQVPIK